MKIITSFSLAVLLLMSIVAFGQNTFKISGYIDTAMLHKYRTQELTMRAQDINISINIPLSHHGQFLKEIKLGDSLTYHTFEIQDNTLSNEAGRYYNISKPNRTNPLPEMYLFAIGDSVKMTVKADNSIMFSGKGSNKLNCQFQLFNLFTLPRPITNRAVTLQNHKKLQNAIQLETEIVKTQVQQMLSLLHSYKRELKENEYSLLYLDAIALLKQQIYYKLPNYYLRFPEKQNQQLVQDYFMSIDSLNFDVDKIADNIKIRSPYYVPMLLEREVTALILFNENRTSYKDFSFEELFYNIKRKYTGLLRDKLILQCFTNYVVNKTEDAKRLYKYAYTTVQLSAYKAILQQLMERYYTPAYPFTFYDASNKPYKLQDFKGKLIVMDFWFSGCVPCTMVAKAMHPIYAKFKYREDVVFITVSTDQKEEWLESIKSGLYTSKGMLNLHTNGKGFKNEMITYYKFTGFPQQLIIDKKGELISASPPRPDVSQENILAFGKLIEDNLKE